MINNSNDIVHGITNSYTDCKSVKKCEQTLGEIKHCEAPKIDRSYKCEQERHVDVKFPDKINKRVTVQLKVSSKWGGTFRYSLRQQAVTSSTGGNISNYQDVGINDISCDVNSRATTSYKLF